MCEISSEIWFTIKILASLRCTSCAEHLYRRF